MKLFPGSAREKHNGNQKPRLQTKRAAQSQMQRICPAPRKAGPACKNSSNYSCMEVQARQNAASTHAPGKPENNGVNESTTNNSTNATNNSNPPARAASEQKEQFMMSVNGRFQNPIQARKLRQRVIQLSPPRSQNANVTMYQNLYNEPCEHHKKNRQRLQRSLDDPASLELPDGCPPHQFKNIVKIRNSLQQSHKLVEKVHQKRSGREDMDFLNSKQTNLKRFLKEEISRYLQPTRIQIQSQQSQAAKKQPLADMSITHYVSFSQDGAQVPAKPYPNIQIAEAADENNDESAEQNGPRD